MVPLQVVVRDLCRHLHFIFRALAVVTLHAALVIIGVTLIMEAGLGVVFVIKDLKEREMD